MVRAPNLLNYGLTLLMEVLRLSVLALDAVVDNAAELYLS